MMETQALKAENGDRNLYWIEKPEHGNKGHYYDFMKSWSYDDRMAVVEYLKTLWGALKELLPLGFLKTNQALLPF